LRPGAATAIIASVTRPRRVVLVAFPDVQVLDVTGPGEVFSLAHRSSARPEYDLQLLTTGGRPFKTSSGLALVPAGSLATCRGAIDTLIVAGGLAGQAADRAGVRELQGWIADNLAADLSVAALAERSFMSPRNFARVFSREVGVTPAAYVEALRLERARVLLETADLLVDEVARRCGFGTVETLRRTFARRLHVSPSDYRDRFAPVPIRRSSATS
jgi:transcriptional regulator GlxA family with amidase domain